MLEEELKSALVGLQEGIEKGDAERIKSNMAYLDETLKSRRREIDPQLKHFLKNRSYVKALMFLNNDADIPKGRCQGRTDFS